MKKLLALGVGLVALLLALTLVAFGIMHTRYLTPSAQWLTEHLWPEKLTFSELDYEYPLHFRLHNVTLETSANPLSFQQVDIWLSPQLFHQDKWVIDSVLLDGANFSDGLPDNDFLAQLQLNQLALHNIDFANRGLIARGVNLQVKKPIWNNAKQWLPYGELQLSAEQFYWQGEALNNVLIDADYKAQDSTVYGASFQWRGGEFSGQAEQYPAGWSLVNVTISKLDLKDDLSTLSAPWWQLAKPYLHHINSLDVLSSNLQLGETKLTNLALSLENLTVDQSLWQQDSGYLSLNAESADWHGLQWIEPTFKLEFRPGNITISDFATELLQGSIQLSGDIQPSGIHLHQLTARGIKWFAEQQQDWAWLDSDLPALKNLTIDQWDLNNLQLIQLTHKPFWQLSGLNVEGRNTELNRNGRWGLWNGKLSISANSASIGPLVSSQGVVEMSSKEAHWQLERAFLPLENGYLDATANWAFDAASAPWNVNLHADGVPLTQLGQWLPLPLKVDALAEIDLAADGLAGDYPMLAHSLSGELNLNLRDGTLVMKNSDALVVQPFSLDGLRLNADRGRLSLHATPLSGPTFNARLHGDIDLVEPKQGMLELEVTQRCDTQHFDLLRNQQREEKGSDKACVPAP
ncbi:AsmA family protein [Vibrio fluvialis]|nr:AsmA family protein [Vibrio fluvialis]